MEWNNPSDSGSEIRPQICSRQRPFVNDVNMTHDKAAKYKKEIHPEVSTIKEGGNGFKVQPLIGAELQVVEHDK
ncbi:hypothetical protein GCM10023325_20390 [Sphingomonas lutea]